MDIIKPATVKLDWKANKQVTGRNKPIALQRFYKKRKRGSSVNFSVLDRFPKTK